MQQVSKHGVDDVARAIEAYLAGHPGAADNEHGIASWWLPGMGFDVPVLQVKQALERLVARGVMVELVLPGGSIYRAAAPGKN